jgi:hypothetical protein
LATGQVREEKQFVTAHKKFAMIFIFIFIAFWRNFAEEKKTTSSGNQIL